MGCSADGPKVPEQPKLKIDIPEYKIIVIGDSSVGKTAIIHQYMNDTFTKDLNPTTGV